MAAARETLTARSRRRPGRGTLRYDAAMRLSLRGLLLIAALCLAVDAVAGVSALRLFAAGATDSGAAAREAAAMTGGRVVDVQTTRSGARVVYVVKVLLDNGRVKVVHIDGAAGSPDGR